MQQEKNNTKACIGCEDVGQSFDQITRQQMCVTHYTDVLPSAHLSKKEKHNNENTKPTDSYLLF